MRNIFFFLISFSILHAFYLPGVAPIDFHPGERIPLLVSSATSDTNVALPYKYYDFPVCAPSDKQRSEVSENLGQILFGERIELSNYMIKMNKETKYRVLHCGDDEKPEFFKLLTENDISDWIRIINENYYGNWILDNLPSAFFPETEEDVTTVGFPLGEVKQADKKVILYNHFEIKIKFHNPASKTPTNTSRIVFFEVKPSSVDWDTQLGPQGVLEEKAEKVLYCQKTGVCDPEKPDNARFIPKAITDKIESEESSQIPKIELDPAQKTTKRVFWTYSVTFTEDPKVAWASRWDVYFKARVTEIHWFSIIYSLLVIIFLTGMIALIMLRILSRDVKRYNDSQVSDEAQEETGWKIVHGDVFRPPSRPSTLSFFVGTGVQVTGMLLVILAFSLFGFLSPASRGALMTAALVFFVFMGTFNGYVAARIYKMLDGTSWKRLTLKSALVFPGIVFGLFLFLNFFIWGQRSSRAVPFGTIFALIGMWFGISVPLVFLGAYFGFKRAKVTHPVSTNQIPRQIPHQVFYMRPLCAYITGGMLPFGAVFIELFFILHSLSQHQIYYLVGFLFVVFIILVVTCAEITIVMCYFQLCAENYHWWWRSFFTPGSSAVYLFIYTICYFFTQLTVSTFVSGLLFFGYMLIIAILFFLVTGTIGFLSCLFFVRKIYSSIKVE